LELKNTPIKGPSGLARTLDRRGLHLRDTPLPPARRPKALLDVSVIAYCAPGRRAGGRPGRGTARRAPTHAGSASG
jgi:hypothetical protein